ncbi:MAG: NifB/NifX family molybdenum-iron cluster-binding protein [Deltaproteobacteria bacterium]|nr:NifB/NifX family molybdenum-iron cluster-binding protein [Deltaproteobacteria bacterium]
MKICISAVASGLDAQVDPRFGRCQYFTIVDTDTMELESVENANIAASGGAGIQSAQFIANKGVEVVLTGNVGPNAYTTLQAAGVNIITGVSGPVREVVEAYKSGRFGAPTSGPTVDAHSGMGGGAAQSPGQDMGKIPQPPGQGMGGGMGMGRGGGMGMGRGGGMGMGRGMGMPPSGQFPSGPAPQEARSKDEELNALKETNKALRSQLDTIMERIDKLEKK